MNWEPWLDQGEIIRWEGKPAPRCFSFRNWKHSFFGILLLLVSVFWEMVGVQLGAAYGLPYVPWIPLPFVLTGLYLTFGHVFLARLEWEKVFFAITDRRVLCRRGFFRPRLEEMDLDNVKYFRLKPLGDELGSFRIEGGGKSPKILKIPCIEHPRRVSALLEAALAANGQAEIAQVFTRTR